MTADMRREMSSVNPYSGIEVNPNTASGGGGFGYGTNIAPGFSDMYLRSAGGAPSDVFSFKPSNRAGMTRELLADESSNVDVNDMPITYPIYTPPWTYASDSNLREQQCLFAIREKDLDERNSTCVLSVPTINTLATEQWQQFVIKTTQGPYYDDEAADFKKWLEEYGERALWEYAWVRTHLNKKKIQEYEAKVAASNLKQFWERAQHPQYCYLTSFGFVMRLNFLGVLEHRSNSGVTEENCMDGGEQVVLAVSFAKRTRVANAFGNADDFIVGGNTWITLTRRRCEGHKIPYGAFVLIPGASRTRDAPLTCAERSYLDESGAICRGPVWRVGRVLEVDIKNAQRSQLDAASNVPGNLSSRVFADVHEGLPRAYIALGL